MDCRSVHVALSVETNGGHMYIQWGPRHTFEPHCTYFSILYLNCFVHIKNVSPEINGKMCLIPQVVLYIQ